MKRNELFVVKKIGGSLYLLPVGQMIADWNRGIKINETCLYVWKQLKEDISLDELLKRCEEHFAPAIDESGIESENDKDGKQEQGKNDDIRNLIRQDITGLVGSLRNRGMLEGSRNVFKCNCQNCQNGLPIPKPIFLDQIGALWDPDKKDALSRLFGLFEIGGLSVSMFGEAGYFDENFESFRIAIGQDEKCQYIPEDVMTIWVRNIDEEGLMVQTEGFYDETAEKKEFSFEEDDAAAFDSSVGCEEGKVLIHHNELTVYEYPAYYILIFNELEGIEELHLTKDGRRAVFYCTSPTEELKFNLFHAIRIAYLIYALGKGKVMLHSSSILYKNRIWAFSAPSGTGKSTHCEIWNKLYGTPVINGDLNLLGIEDDRAYVYGTPWCGTSGIFDTKIYPLGGVILLKQGPQNLIKELSDEQKELLVQQRLVTSVWDEAMLDKTFEIVSDLVENIYVTRYYCTKEDEAAQIIHSSIENYIVEQSKD